MSNFVNTPDRNWDTVDVVGMNMDRCVLWGGGLNVFTGFFRMPAGMCLPLHKHSLWVQVLVLQGRMQVESGGGGTRVIDPGGYYFVEPGDTHVEKALEDTLVFVTSQVETGRHTNVVMP